MKQIFILILCIIPLTTSALQTDSIEYKTLPQLDVTFCSDDSLQKLVGNQFEVFDQALFDNIKGDGSSKYDTLANGNTVYLLSNEKEKYLGIKLKPMPIKILKFYYGNGNIKKKGLYLDRTTLHFGTWYEFDEAGNLTDSINYSEGFKHSLCEIYTYARSLKMEDVLGEHFMKFYGWNPKVKEVFENPIIKITMPFSKNKGWGISWRFNNIGGYWRFEIEIDDKTGKIYPIDRYQDIPEKYKTSSGLPVFP